SLWFKMPSGSSAGGVLYAYQSATIENPAGATGGWVPALYVGTDGLLRGHFWIYDMGKIVNSTTAVNDGQWHHVALAASTNSQSLYLDGVLVGSPVNATLVSASDGYAFVGAGKWSGSWPMHGAGEVGFWPGQIAEFAYFKKQLSPKEVQAQFDAKNAAGTIGSW